MNDRRPDWKGFGQAVMEYWPLGEIDGGTIQDLAEEHGLIVPVPGGFDPKIHEDHYGGAEAGDPWFMKANA